MRNFLLISLLAFALGLAACGGDDASLQITDTIVGDGAQAQEGDFITVHYTGWLEDGTEFDSSVGGEPITFPLSGLIAGWQEGIPGMKVGGKRELIIPPSLAYGEAGRPGIPPNATLTFEIELVNVEPPPTPTPAP